MNIPSIQISDPETRALVEAVRRQRACKSVTTVARDLIRERVMQVNPGAFGSPSPQNTDHPPSHMSPAVSHPGGAGSSSGGSGDSGALGDPVDPVTPIAPVAPVNPTPVASDASDLPTESVSLSPSAAMPPRSGE